MRVGDTVTLSGMTVTVASLMPDGRPAACDFRFARPLDAPEYVWMRWGKGAFVPFTPPEMGGTVVLAAASVGAAVRDAEERR
jgi:hypothetical protein